MAPTVPAGTLLTNCLLQNPPKKLKRHSSFTGNTGISIFVFGGGVLHQIVVEYLSQWSRAPKDLGVQGPQGRSPPR